MRRNGCRVLTERYDAKSRHESMPDPVREAHAWNREKINDNARRIRQLEEQVEVLTCMLERRGVPVRVDAPAEDGPTPCDNEVSASGR